MDPGSRGFSRLSGMTVFPFVPLLFLRDFVVNLTFLPHPSLIQTSMAPGARLSQTQ